MKEKFKKHKKLFIILIIVIAGAVAVGGFFLYRKKKQEAELAASMNQPVIESAVRQDIKTSFSVQGRVVGGDTQVPDAAGVSSSVSGTGADSSSTDASASAGTSGNSSAGTSSASGTSSSSGTSASSDVTGEVSADSGNKVKEVFVKVGDTVKAGDPLYSIDMSEVEDSLWLTQQKLALQQRQNALDIAAKKRALTNAQADTADQTRSSNEAVSDAAIDAQAAANAQKQANTDYQTSQIAENSASLSVTSAQVAYEQAKAKAEKAQAAYDEAVATQKKAARAVSNAGTTDSIDTNPDYLEAQADVAEAQNAKTAAENAYTDGQAAYAKIESPSAINREELANLSAAVKTATEKVNAAQKKVSDIELKYNRAKAAAAADARKLQAAKDAADDAVDAAESEKTKAENAVTAAETAYNEAKANLTTAQGNTKEAKSKIDDSATTATSKQRDLTKAQLQAGTDLRAKQSAEATASDDIASTQIDYAEGLLEQQQTIKKAEEQLAKGTIVAGIDGTVTAVNIAPGQTLTSNPVVISNLNSLKAVVDVEEAHIADVFVGQTVYMTTDSTGDETVTGQVTYCAVTPTTDSSSTTSTGTSGTDTSLINSKKKVYYRVEVAITSSIERLRIGMNAKMEFVTAEAKDVISVPNDTIMTDMDGDTCVYVMNTGDGNTDSSDTAGGDSSSTEIPATDENGNQIIGGADGTTDIYVSGDGTSDGTANSSDTAGSGDTMTDSAGNVYHAVKVTTGVTDGNYTEITSGNINEGDSLYGTGMTSDMTGMDGTDSTYTDNSQLLEGIYN